MNLNVFFFELFDSSGQPEKMVTVSKHVLKFFFFFYGEQYGAG